MAPEKIILVQLFSNGDCLYATTVARQVKKDFPGCHLTWAIASFCKDIIANNPYVDNILEVSTVKKNDTAALRRFKKDIFQQQKEGIYDKVFFIHNGDTNAAYYDGCIRSSIFRAYQMPITVPVQPVLCLYPGEIARANQFAHDQELQKYKAVILFEYAPQSGQSAITIDLAIKVAEKIVANDNFAVILSSANTIDHPNKAIIDGSSLTLRETAALSNHCTFLLGTSSGITWITTSQAGKQLPMVQLLNPYTRWVNPISRDFKRFNIPDDRVIELFNFDETTITSCVNHAINDFETAKQKYSQPIPLHFKTTRSIVYNLLCYLEIAAIIKHVKVNREVYGNNFSFYKELFWGIALAPFTLLKHLLQKHVFKTVK